MSLVGAEDSRTSAVPHSDVVTTSDADDWIVDDPAIPDAAYVHRRLNDSQALVFDDLLGRWVPTIAAYTYRGDGMSVYVSTAMLEHALTDDELLPMCTYGLARVTVEVVRRTDTGTAYNKADMTSTVADGEAHETAGGVIMAPAETGIDDERVRHSHGLVRIRERPVARKLWSAFRHKLLQGTEYRRSAADAWQHAFDSA